MIKEQKINSIFDTYKLLGNFDFTENEYTELLEKVALLSHSLVEENHAFEEKNYKWIFITLIEMAKRWKDSYNEGDIEEKTPFWNYISKHVINEDHHINSKLYNAFTYVITQLGKQHAISVVQTGKKYYSTLMMHSFAAKKSVFSFYDLCYNIFKKDLDYGYTKDDEWICKVVAAQIRRVVSGGYCENKKVSIGSSVYSIKIGLKSFSQNTVLYPSFIRFINDTFNQINKLFNREPINEKTRLERYIVEWWKVKTESEKDFDSTTNKRRVPTVSKDNIVAKYIRENDSVLLYIPSIRLENNDSIVSLIISVNGEQIQSKNVRTKRGELVVTTKEIRLELDDLLKNHDTINLKVEMRENDTVIFDSEKNKATTLNREFILFEGEKEVLSQTNKPSNYFVYSKDIDALKSKPDELTTCVSNLYNIYPKAGESLSGEIKQVYFLDTNKTDCIGKKACLIGGKLNVEWFCDDISCIVYSSGVKLLVPKNANLKALELRVDKKNYKLKDLPLERKERGCYQFGLKALGLIIENYPTEINLYSYEKESTILSESIIVLSNLDIQFNHSFYYGDLDRKVTIDNGNETIQRTWTNQENEIICPFNDGMLLIKVAYLRWRIYNKEWHNEAINRKLWYKDFLDNGDLLEIDIPPGNYEIVLFEQANGKYFEISRNQRGNYEIGRVIYGNSGLTDIAVFTTCGNDSYSLFNLATKEHFITNPLSYVDGRVFWNVEDAFVGDKSNDFFLIVKSEENDYRSEMENKNGEIENLHQDRCKIKIKIKDKNIFSKRNTYHLIYETELIIGTAEELRFKHKKIRLLSANCYRNKQSEWIHLVPDYFIENLKMIKENDITYYIGQLYEIDLYGKKRYLDTMENEDGIDEKTNPVRIELRDNCSFWMVAGWEGDFNFIGEFFCDKLRKRICNIQKENNRFDEIRLYKFEEEDYV